jgi:hypothetical protein
LETADTAYQAACAVLLISLRDRECKTATYFAFIAVDEDWVIPFI